MTGALAASGVFGQSAPAPSVSISDATVSDTAIGTAIASYSINSDGTVRTSSDDILQSWLLGGGTNSNYDVMATVTSGTLSSGTTGSWLNCGTTRTWALTNGLSNNSVKTAVFTLQMRLASTGVVQDSAVITLRAESDNLN
jgi:hypothetical protein